MDTFIRCHRNPQRCHCKIPFILRRLLYHEKLPTWVMVFEDITKQGYEMKVKQLDLEESKVVFAKVARWHAASMHLVDTVSKRPSYTA